MPASGAHCVVDQSRQQEPMDTGCMGCDIARVCGAARIGCNARGIPPQPRIKKDTCCELRRACAVRCVGVAASRPHALLTSPLSITFSASTASLKSGAVLVHRARPPAWSSPPAPRPVSAGRRYAGGTAGSGFPSTLFACISVRTFFTVSFGLVQKHSAPADGSCTVAPPLAAEFLHKANRSSHAFRNSPLNRIVHMAQLLRQTVHRTRRPLLGRPPFRATA